MTVSPDTFTKKFAPFARRMQAEGLPEIAINTFGYYYRQLLEGATGFIPEEAIIPVETVPDADTFSAELALAGQAALSQTVLLKLNGGLGTGMGLEDAKSLLMVKNGLTFLDIIARQAIQAGVPLVLMDSFATRAGSLAALQAYPQLQTDIPLDFLQHKVPKIDQQTLSPVLWTPNPDLEWCPPGHGDIYTALQTSGMLNTLLAKGYRYAFVSNADNLGAVLDPAILGYFVTNNLPFMMEVADRTAADKKGGHLTKTADGQLILREAAQCPPHQTATFQDITRHKYFNTNNLWLNLPLLNDTLSRKYNILGLALICNAKTVDPRDPASPAVFQLETAMGSAIAVFAGAGAIRVSRSRFAPVKTTSDLLAVRSDAYLITDDYRVIPHPHCHNNPPLVMLDPTHYKLISNLEAGFPAGPPSLRYCHSFTIRGRVIVGKNVVIKGNVTLTNNTLSAPIFENITLEG